MPKSTNKGISKRRIFDTPLFILTERKGRTFIVLLVLVLIVALSGCLGSCSRLPAEDSRVTGAREQCDVDLNSDGDCDRDDTRLLAKAIGACKDTDDYYEPADVDGDGCVTKNDQELLFPMFIRDDGGRSCDLDHDDDCDKDDWKLYLMSEHMSQLQVDPLRGAIEAAASEQSITQPAAHVSESEADQSQDENVDERQSFADALARTQAQQSQQAKPVKPTSSEQPSNPPVENKPPDDKH